MAALDARPCLRSKRARALSADDVNDTSVPLLALLAAAYYSRSDTDTDTDTDTEDANSDAKLTVQAMPAGPVPAGPVFVGPVPAGPVPVGPAPAYASAELESLARAPASAEGWVYELECADGCVYVGHTRRCVDERVREHWGGGGAAWTAAHAPQRVVAIAAGSEMDETVRTLQRAAERGVDCVRGGRWGEETLSAAARAEFRMLVASTQNLCYKCNAHGHKASACLAHLSGAGELSTKQEEPRVESTIAVSLWAKVNGAGPYVNTVTVAGAGAGGTEGPCYDVVYSGQKILPGHSRGFADHLVAPGAAFFFAKGSDPWTLAGVVAAPVTSTPPARRGDTWRYAFRVTPHPPFSDGTRPPARIKGKADALRALRMRVPPEDRLVSGIVQH